jgi:DHA2 family multidrug resistance protein
MAEYLNVFNPLWRFGTTPMENGIPVDRARLLSYMMPFGGGWPYGSVPTDDPTKLVVVWGEEMARQASTIAYLNDFRVMTVVTWAVIPLLFFMRRQAMFTRAPRG